MIYFGIAMLILTVDLSIKFYIEKHRTIQQKDTVCQKIIIRKHHNKGITLNKLSDHPRLVRSLSAGMTVILMLVSILSFFGKRGKGDSTGHKLGLSFLLGGSLSNTYDRVFRGYVVDYFSFNVKWEKLRNIIFNIADLFILAGSLLTGLCNHHTADTTQAKQQGLSDRRHHS